ncbi:dihydropteroate synthase [Clostridium vincentii]|uniref:Dihydropteroate synthase n=1 Tax=Clostridium vincentii TaxID=52704 RepID=A0A2T0BHP7_9CLOT|nr:dihydropteroate synthase [Clostridium vincentii]PRR83409.1 Dihydropteroate synthase [Clostridium vincentii]
MIIGNKNFVIGERTFVMGILNVTPDSFSDGGKYNEVDLAVKRAEILIKDGADIIDIGGESTRPNSEDVDDNEEIQRVVPIIKAIKEKFDIPISIDTYKAKTAEAAILAGADLINDVWGFKKDKNMAKIAAKYKVPCILMHNREDFPYNEIMKDILMELIDSINLALEAGVKRENIILDPGIGFGKNYEENLIVMNNLEQIKTMGFPMLLGTSRKSMIGNALGLPVDNRVEGTLATTVIGIMKGCEFVRVHDVLENKRACIMTDKILSSK